VIRRERYAAFSDESKHSDGRFRSIATVSLDADIVLSVSDAVKRICDESDVREFKWQKLAGARERFCAVKVIDHLCSDLIPPGVRVDVIIWDTHDARHKRANRDDPANFERMFFHLHHGTMRRRPRGAHWHLRPDEQVEIDWATVRSCLSAAGRSRRRFEHPLFPPHEDQFEVRSFKEVVSTETPLCQLADFFAGIAPYTREKANTIRAWLRTRNGQQSLDGMNSDLTLSRSDKERLPVVEHLYERCLTARLGVSLETDGYFRSRRGDGAINFWHYEPQHSRDRAPTRAVRS
jgi:hypothetical protein